MPIYENSRYATAEVVSVADSDSTYHATIFVNTVPAAAPQYTPYSVRPGDRLDTIANVAYGDPELWWVVADANRDKLFYPDDLKVGTILKLPTHGAF